VDSNDCWFKAEIYSILNTFGPDGCVVNGLIIYIRYQSDFSFKNLEKTLNEYFSIKKPPTAEKLKKAKILSDSLENQFQIDHTEHIETGHSATFR
jgi:hypothetical protein